MNATNLKKIQTLFEEVTLTHQIFSHKQEIIDKEILLDKIKEYYSAVRSIEIHPNSKANSPTPKIENIQTNIIQNQPIEEIISIENIQPIEQSKPEPIPTPIQPISQDNSTEIEEIKTPTTVHQSISSFIDLNTRFGLIQHLFKGDIQAYQSAIEHFDNLKSSSEIMSYFKDLTKNQNLDTKSELFEVFEKIIIRYAN